MIYRIATAPPGARGLVGIFPDWDGPGTRDAAILARRQDFAVLMTRNYSGWFLHRIQQQLANWGQHVDIICGWEPEKLAMHMLPLNPQIETLRNSNPDLATLYPPADLMPNPLRRARDIAFGGNDPDKTQPEDLTVPEVTQEPTETTRGLLNTAKVQITARGARNFPIEDILLYIQTALENDPSNLMFLSEIAVRTTPQGWRLEGLEFRRYNINRRR